MRHLLLWAGLILCLSHPVNLFAQDSESTASGVQVERFRLKNGRTYEGIWDAKKPQIRLVNKSEHVGNLPVTANDIAKRDIVRDGSDIKILSDLEIAEKVVASYAQYLKTARAKVATTARQRDALHQAYKGKNLPKPTYDAVMKQYKAADDAVANAEKTVTAAQAAFDKACATYEQLGGKTDYRSKAQ